MELQNKEYLDNLLAPMLKYPRLYLSILFVILVSIPLLTNYSSDKPLLMGPENYYHLYESQHVEGRTFFYYPLHLITSYIPEKAFFLFPPLIILATLWIWYSLARRLELGDKLTFLFSLFLIATPIFIFTSITFSSYNLLLFLLVLGFWLLTLDHPGWRYLALVPFLLSTLLDFFTSMFVIILLFIYYQRVQARSLEQKRLLLVVAGLTLAAAFLTKLFLHVQWVLGPFHVVHPLTELISDLGGESGIPFFTLLLALLSFAFIWKESKYRSAYLPFVIATIAYFINQHFLLPFVLLTAFFASIGFIKIFDSDWALPTLKKFTLLLLLLGIIFSLLTYFNRVSEIGPSNQEIQTLEWIKDNYANDPKYQRIFSASENSYYIAYFSGLRPLYDYHLPKENRVWVNLSQDLKESTYISTTLPLLEAYDVYILYIAEEMKKTYPADQGILFVLKNERFKLVHSSENNEVWVFE